MPRHSEQAREVAYPQLTRAQIDAIISALAFWDGAHAAGPVTPGIESALGYLISFRTRRWGLPPALAARLGGQPVTAQPPD
jgi:hypothetical protein